MLHCCVAKMFRFLMRRIRRAANQKSFKIVDFFRAISGKFFPLFTQAKNAIYAILIKYCFEIVTVNANAEIRAIELPK